MSAPAGRTILFGATGYTGRIAARRLIRSGVRPVLVGRSADRLRALAKELAAEDEGADLTFEVADADRPASFARLATEPDDVVITTVGPYARLGAAALDAAIGAGCAYVDASSEPEFLRRVFTDGGPRARETGARLLPAMGYEFVLGNLAAGLLLARNPDVARLEIGYFVTGPFAPSSGTIGSEARVMLADSFAYRDGSLVSERPGARIRRFEWEGTGGDGLSIGSTEQLALPRTTPGLRDVSVHVGWAGKWARAASAASAFAMNAMQLPGVGSAMGAVVRSALGGASAEGQPDHLRAKTRSVAIAEGFVLTGEPAGRVRVEGPSPYDLTGSLLAWSASMLARRLEHGTGALGPVEAFGLDALVAGCLALGLGEVADG